MNVRTTVLGMALTILGIFIPLVGWFFLLPVGLIVIVAGLIMKEKPAQVKQELGPEEVLLEVDLVTSEMEALLDKIPELSRKAKTSVELADQYETCLQDAESKVGLAEYLEGSLTQIIEKVKQQLQVTESAMSGLERSKEVYGVKAESLETKIAQEKANLDELTANVEKWGSMLRKLRLKRNQLADLMSGELVSKRPKEIGLYFKVLMKYREKYGEKAEKKLKRDLGLGGRRLQELYNIMYGEEVV